MRASWYRVASPMIAAVASATLLVGVAPACADDVPGAPLSAWSRGTLDIHYINTAQGDSALLILPDGTTLLIDVGDARVSARPPRYKAPPRPDETRSPGEWVARYIQRRHPQGADGALDYVLLTHFDGDHAAGFGDLARHVKIRRVLDRAWPDYERPRPLNERYRAAVDAYLAVVKRFQESGGLEIERFVAGRNDQLVLRHAPQDYPSFEVRNLAVNGEVWTGHGTATSSRFPSFDPPAENPCSTAIRLRYGRFTYYHGGDLVGQLREGEPAWRDVESALAWATGPVDVHVCDHHGYHDSSNAFFLSVLRPRVHIVQVWSSAHPAPEVLDRLRSEKIYPGPRDVFATNGVWEGRREHVEEKFGAEAGARYIAELGKLTGSQGHIVVRVAPGGESYRVFMLDETTEEAPIKSVHGPYEPR